MNLSELFANSALQNSYCAEFKDFTYCLSSSPALTPSQMPFVHPGFEQRGNSRPPNFSVSMRPRYLPAIIEVMKLYEWKSVYYLYDSDNGKCAGDSDCLRLETLAA